MTDERHGQSTRTRRIPNQPDDTNGHPSRVPPSDLHAEESLLGAAMLADSALEILATQTRPEDFYKPAHGHIAAVLTSAYEQRWPADSVTVAAELRRRGLLESIGGPATLAQIMSSTPATTNAGRYASIVHDHATLRRLIHTSAEISEKAYTGSDDAHDSVLRAQALLDTVASSNGSRAYSTLDVADIAALLDGDLEMEEADFLRRNDGRALFYAGKMHVLQAEPSSGKSWLALWTVLEILLMGGSGLYIDYEDSSRGILGRLLTLGAEPAMVRDRLKYVQPAGGFGTSERIELERIVAALNPDIVVIDGVAEALARDGYQEDKASDVVAWVEKLPRWLARTGAAVIMLDHLVKDREQQGRYARGSGAKLAVVDGASYHVKVVSPFSRHRAGILKLMIAKDRPGGVGAVGECAAVVKVEPKADGARVLISVERDTGEVRTTDQWKPTMLMTKVSKVLESVGGPITPARLKDLVTSDKPKLVAEAISRLIVEGYVIETKIGRYNNLKLVKPYTDGSTPPTPTEPPPGLFPDEDIEPEPVYPDNVTKGPWPEGEEEF